MKGRQQAKPKFKPAKIVWIPEEFNLKIKVKSKKHEINF
jgi:hypothetical protein